MHEITESNTMKNNEEWTAVYSPYNRIQKYTHGMKQYGLYNTYRVKREGQRPKMNQELKALQLSTSNVWHEVVGFSALLISISRIPIIEHVSIRFLYFRPRIKHTNSFSLRNIRTVFFLFSPSLSLNYEIEHF